MGLLIMLSDSISVILLGINLKKYVFANRVFTVILGSKEFLGDQKIFIVMQYLLAQRSIAHKAEIFSYLFYMWPKWNS